MLHYVETREPHDVRGYVSMPTGSGKTVIFAEVIKQLNLPTLVLVPTTQLIDQTLSQLRKRLPDKKIDSLKGGGQDSGQYDVLVATYAALARRVDDADHALNPDNYKLVILDEAHRSMGTMSRRFIDEHLSHAMHLGFTATENYNSKRRLFSYLHDEIHKISVNEAVELGMISPYRVASLHTEGDMINVSVARDEYNQVELGRVVENAERNRIIVDYYSTNLAGEKAMFNVNTVEHADALAEQLRQSGIRAAATYGAQSKQTQKAILKAFKDGEIMALVQAKLLGEGYDEPTLGVVINVTPTMSFVRSQQRSGRALRLDPARPNKVALIVECVDDNYVRLPAYFGDDEVAGSYGVDSFVNVQTVDGEYRTIAPDYKPLEDILAFYTGDSRRNSITSSRLKKAQVQKDRHAHERLRKRREVRQNSDLDDFDFRSEHDDIQLDIQKLCTSNPIIDYIVNGVEIGDTEITHSNVRAALSQVAGLDLLESSDTMTRYILVQKLYRDVEQKSNQQSDGMKLRDHTGTVVEYSEAEVQLAHFISKAQGMLPTWRHSGACIDAPDKSIFFPASGERIKDAVAICAGCSVRTECLEYALENRIKHGIWGGASERKRRRIRRERNIASLASLASNDTMSVERSGHSTES